MRFTLKKIMSASIVNMAGTVFLRYENKENLYLITLIVMDFLYRSSVLESEERILIFVNEQQYTSRDG